MGVLELTANIASNWRNEGVDDADNDYVEITVSLDGDSSEVMETILNYGGGKAFANQTVEYVELEGTEFDLVDVTTPTTTEHDHDTTDSYEKEEEDGNDGRVVGWIVVVVVLVVVVAVLTFVLVKRMNDDGQKRKHHSSGLGIEMNDTETDKDTLMDKTTETPKETQDIEEASDEEEVIPVGKPTKR